MFKYTQYIERHKCTVGQLKGRQMLVQTKIIHMDIKLKMCIEILSRDNVQTVYEY